MNCRRINSLLSAYLDSELTGAEMLSVRDHLDRCDACREEYEALRETKRLVASLAFRAPRAELEALLMVEAERASAADRGAVGRLLGWLGLSGSPAGAPAFAAPLSLRSRPVAATAVLSLAGLWLASASLDGPNHALAPAGPIAFEPVPGVASTSTIIVSSSALAAPAPPVAPAGVYAAGWVPAPAAPYARASYYGGGSGLQPAAMSVPMPTGSGGGGTLMYAAPTAGGGATVTVSWGGAFGPGAAALLSTARRFAGH